MPRLADAYADAHLNLDTLDVDISKAIKKIEVAAQRFEELLKVKVDLDTALAEQKLRDLEIESRNARDRISGNATITIDANTDQLLQDLAAIEQLKRDIAETVTVAIDINTSDALAQLERFKAQIAQLDNNITVDINANTDLGTAIAELAELQAAIEAIDGVINIKVEIDSGGLLEELAAIEALKLELGKDVQFGVDVLFDQMLEIFAEIEALKALLGKDLKIDVDVDDAGAKAKLAALLALKNTFGSKGGGGGGFLSGLFGGGGGGLGGIGGIGSLLSAALPAAIGAAVVALGPLVPGLIGASVAFLGLAAAAGAAAGGLSALAVFTDESVKQQLGVLTSGFTRLLRDVLQPVIGFIRDSVLPAFFSIATEFTLRVGPSLIDGLVPIASAILSLFRTLAQNIAPLIQPLAEGIAGFINIFTNFIPQLMPVAQMLMGPFFNALNGLVEIFLATAVAAAPLVALLLDGIGNGLRGLITPINNLVNTFVPLIQQLASGLGDSLGQLGPIWRDLGTAVYTAVGLITDVINGIGLQNIIFLIAGIAAAFGAWPVAIGLALVAFNQVDSTINLIRAAFEKLKPLFTNIATTAKLVFENVIAAVGNFIAALDFDAIISGFNPVLDTIVGIATVLPGLGTAFGEIANVLVRLLPLLGIFVAYKVASTVVGWLKAIKGAAQGIWAAFGVINTAFKTAAEASAKAGGGLQGLGAAMKSLATSGGLATIATAGLTIAIVAATAVYAAWAGAKAKAKAETDALTEALLSEQDATKVTNEALTKGFAEKGLLDDLNQYGISIADLGNELRNSPGSIDKFRDVWDDFVGSLGKEPIGLDPAQFSELEAAATAAGATVPDVFRAVNEAVNNGLDPALARDFINEVTNLDQSSGQAFTNLESQANSARTELERLGKSIPPDLRKKLDDALASKNPDILEKVLIDLKTAFPDLANVITVTASETGKLDEYTREAKDALGLLGDEADDLANSKLPEASRALSKFAKELENGAAGEAVAASFKRAQEAYDKAGKAQDELGKKAQATVKELTRGGSISEFFKIEKDKTVNAAEETFQAINKLVQATFANGRLSSFIDEESLSINRSVEGLVTNLKTQASNARRLAAIQAAGFRVLAIQLATLATNPQQLAGLLDQLDAQGNFADLNNQLQGGISEVSSTLAGLDPAIQAALGLDKSSEALKEQQNNILQGLDQLAITIALRISNIRRLAQLQAQGYEPLAIQLATLVGDPTTLNAALDQLDAAGDAAKARESARFASLTGAYGTELRKLDATLAAAVNFEDTAAAFKDGQVGISAVIDQFIKDTDLQIKNIDALKFLRTAGFGNIVSAIYKQYADDPVALGKAIDAIAATPVDILKGQEEALTNSVNWANNRVAQASVELLGAGFDDPAVNEAKTKAANAGTTAAEEYTKAVQQGITDKLPTAVVEGNKAGFNLLGQQLGAQGANAGQAAAPGAPTPPAPTPGTTVPDENMASVARNAATAFAEGFAKKFAEEGGQLITATVNELISKLDLVTANKTDNPFYNAGLTYASNVISGMIAGFKENMGKDEEFDLQGVIIETLINGPNGINDPASVKDGVFIEMKAAGATLAGSYFQGIIETFSNSGVLYGPVLRLLARAALLPFGAEFIAEGNALGIDFLNSITQALNAETQPDSTIVLDDGKKVGRAFGDGIMIGLDEKIPALVDKAAGIAAWLRATVEAGLEMNSPSRVGMSIGNLFVEGIAIGLESSQGRIEQAAGTITNALTTSMADMQSTITTDSLLAGVTTPEVGAIGGALSATGAVLPANTTITGVPTLVGAPTPIAAPSATSTTDTLLLQQVLVELQGQNALVRSAATRPLIGEYNVATTKEPQSPDQLAQDAAFAKALLL